MKKYPFYLSLALAGFLSACGGGSSSLTNPSNPKNLDGGAAPTEISLRATSTSASTSPKALKSLASHLTTADAGSSNVEITAASMTVERIDIHLPDGILCADIDFSLAPFASCESESQDDSPEDSTDDEDQISLNGPFAFDLLTGVSTPDIGTFSIPSGLIREIRLRVANLTVTGSVDLNGIVKSLDINVDLNEDIEFSHVEGLEVSEALSLNHIVLSFDVSQWLNGVDFESCVQPEDDQIDLLEEDDSGSCSELKDVIEGNIDDSTEMSEYHPYGDDGIGDDSEDDSSDDNGDDDAGDDHGGDDL